MTTNPPPQSARVPTVSLSAIRLGLAIMLFAMAFMVLEIAEEIMDALGVNVPLILDNRLLEFFEIASVFGLGLVVVRLYSHMKVLQRTNSSHAETISLLRGQFGEVLETKFAGWRLTHAEQDVTMLILKGLSVADIAAARSTAPGTVKAQSTSIFRKVGVASKSELLSLIIDEFLDGVTPAPATST